MRADPSMRYPITILTGFLGAGKTTMLNRLVGQPGFENSAIVINEIGEVGVDQLLVAERTVDPILLAGGCICCTFSKEVGHVLRDLHERRELGLIPPFERVVIETTGLADPLPILREIAGDAWINRHFVLGAVAALVDLAVLEHGHDLLNEAVAQIAVADRLILTKSDLIAPDRQATAKDLLRAINPEAPITVSAFGEVDPAFLLSAPTTPAIANDTGSAPHHPSHSIGVRTTSLSVSGALSWTEVAKALDRFVAQHGPDLLRLKGVLTIAGSARPVAVHAVQGLFYPPEFLAPPADGSSSNRVVLIGRNLDLAEAVTQLREALAACRPLAATMELDA